ncbi:ABC transporter permease [Streptomyces sp. NPDC005917]|uniref:ABC transporter permease n=1 Tax=unclassified Streptomyces TaxID=2593676 RepID=UPI0033FF8E7A
MAAAYPRTDRTTRRGFVLVLGIALLYTGISLVNPMVVATADRGRELAALRLAGATRRQVLRLVGAEALTVVAVGAVPALLVTTLNLMAVGAALHVLYAPASLARPLPALGATTGTCATLAVLAARAAPAAAATRATPLGQPQ